MPPTFLSLPREIRDQIYTYILVSPDGLIEPSVFPSGRCTLHLFPLRTHSSTTSRSLTHTEYMLPGFSSRRLKTTSTSIIRVCAQIYHETSSMFWERNTFFFPVRSFTPGIQALLDTRATIKAMGQVASRKITRVCIYMHQKDGMSSNGIKMAHKLLGKNLQIFASRARLGDLKHLELVWNWESMRVLEASLISPNLDLQAGFDVLLACLRSAGTGLRSVERVLRLPRDIVDENGTFKPDLAEKMHLAFGGQLFIGEVLVWEDGRRVGGESVESG